SAREISGNLVLRAGRNIVLRLDLVPAPKRKFAAPALPRSVGKGIPVPAAGHSGKRSGASSVEDSAEQAERPIWALPPDKYRAQHSGFQGGEQAGPQRGFLHT